MNESPIPVPIPVTLMKMGTFYDFSRGREKVQFHLYERVGFWTKLDLAFLFVLYVVLFRGVEEMNQGAS